MRIESARFTLDALELVIDGRKAFCDTKLSLLEAGIAVLQDPDLREPYWATVTLVRWEADPANGRGELVIPGGTREPQVVALARR